MILVSSSSANSNYVSASGGVIYMAISEHLSWVNSPPNILQDKSFAKMFDFPRAPLTPVASFDGDVQTRDHRRVQRLRRG